MTAEKILRNGTKVPLDNDLATQFPFNAKLTAHRVHSGMENLGGFSVPQVGGTYEKTTARLFENIFNATMSSHVSNVYSIPTVRNSEADLASCGPLLSSVLSRIVLNERSGDVSQNFPPHQAGVCVHSCICAD